MPDGMTGYDPERLGELRRRVRSAVEDLAAVTCPDVAAAAGRDAVASTAAHLRDVVLPAIGRILANDALTTSIAGMGVDEVVAFLRDDPLGRVVFDLIDVADQGDVGAVDGNWSTQDVAAATDRDVVRDLVGQLVDRHDLTLSDDEVGTLVSTVTAVATRLVDSDEAWEGIDDEVGWYESVTDLVDDVWDRVSTYGQYLAQSGARMLRDPVQAGRDVLSGTTVVEQVAAAEAILLEDGELYMDDGDGACGVDAECIVGARTLPGAAATTFGHSVLIAEDDPDDVPDELVSHEAQHVSDIEAVGGLVFYGTYGANYAWNAAFEIDDVVLDGESVDEAHDDAYDHVIWEERAVDAQNG